MVGFHFGYFPIIMFARYGWSFIYTEYWLSWDNSVQLYSGRKNKNFLKDSFGTYVSPELIDQMYESGEEPSLGGEEGYHTAFLQIFEFSAFSEKLTASELVALLNQYLTDMTDVLLENNGNTDKYIGDAIVAFYGAQ